MSHAFKPNPNGTNELLSGDGFYLSYNANPGGSGFFGGDDGSDETMLAIRNGQSDGRTLWLCLNGDFREEYTEAFPRGLSACIAVYESHRATRRSTWSTDDVTEADALKWLVKRFAASAE